MPLMSAMSLFMTKFSEQDKEQKSFAFNWKSDILISTFYFLLRDRKYQIVHQKKVIYLERIQKKETLEIE